MIDLHRQRKIFDLLNQIESVWNVSCLEPQRDTLARLTAALKG